MKTKMKKILITPQPMWEEEPEKNDEGQWCGRYQAVGGDPENLSLFVEIDCQTPPDSLVIPIYENNKWYWSYKTR